MVIVKRNSSLLSWADIPSLCRWILLFFCSQYFRALHFVTKVGENIIALLDDLCGRLLSKGAAWRLVLGVSLVGVLPTRLDRPTATTGQLALPLRSSTDLCHAIPMMLSIPVSAI